MTMIHELPGSEKPREKALRFGIRTLSSRELLAVVLRTGSKGISALETADLLMKKAGSFSGLARLSVQEICEIRGLSEVKALQLQACFEVSRRAMSERAFDENLITCPQVLAEWLQSELGPCMQEKFLAVYLNSAYRMISCRTLFVGTINCSNVYPREIFREALLLSSTYIILAHNHPSGDLTPSLQDIAVTDRIVSAGRIMGVKVLDHLIVSQSGYLSFAAESLLEGVEDLGKDDIIG